MPSPVRGALEEYLAGRASVERVVIAAAVAYYGPSAGGTRAALGPLIGVIERASPGIVELGGVAGAPGFDVRLVERPFPPAYEDELREAARTALAGLEHAAPLGLWHRVLGALRRVLTA